MGVSEPLMVDDAISVSLPALRSSEIRALVSLGKLIVLTEESEWTAAAQSNAEALTPRSIELVPQSYYGCSNVPPIMANSAVLFVQRDGRVVREYGYDFKSDGFTGMDRSVLSAHLFEGREIVAWAHQQHPNGVIWVALSDGALLSLTYMPEHEIWAWARHDMIRGRVVDVCATGALMSDGDGDVTETDEVYLLVERDDGDGENTELFVERVRRSVPSDTPGTYDAVCMDCCERVTHGVATDQHPVALPDGDATLVDLETGAVETVTVASGVAESAEALSDVIVGQKIESELTTVRPQPQDRDIQWMRKRITKAVLRLRRSAGGEVKAHGSRATVDAIRNLSPSVNASVITLASGDREVVVKGYDNNDGQFTLTHGNVWPFTLLMAILEMEVGDGARS
jgi:hypothetical protein